MNQSRLIRAFVPACIVLAMFAFSGCSSSSGGGGGDGDTFSGTATHRYTTLSGYCSNLPCDYSLIVSGSRCDNCWPGCVESLSAPTVFSTERPKVVKKPFAAF